MRDFLGKQVNVGDRVVYPWVTNQKSLTMKSGQVSEFEPHDVIVVDGDKLPVGVSVVIEQQMKIMEKLDAAEEAVQP